MNRLKRLEQAYKQHIQELRAIAGSFTQPSAQAAYYKMVEKTFEALYLIQFKIVQLEKEGSN